MMSKAGRSLCAPALFVLTLSFSGANKIAANARLARPQGGSKSYPQPIVAAQVTRPIG
jgi:hypothetical protein